MSVRLSAAPLSVRVSVPALAHTSKLLYVLNSGSDRYADTFRLADTIYVCMYVCMYVIIIRCDKRTSNNKHRKQRQNNVHVKGKVFPYSLPSVGPGADPGVQAVSLQVT